jgi:hypothetical protein
MRVVRDNDKIDTYHPNKIGHRVTTQEIYNYLKKRVGIQ